MRYLLLLFLGAILIACGPSEEELESARNLDQATRQLNSICGDFVDGISDEGELSKVEMGNYYSGYTDRVQSVKQELAGKTLVGEYRKLRTRHDSVSRAITDLIRVRRSYISDVLDLVDIVEDFRENVSRAEERDYRCVRKYLN